MAPFASDIGTGQSTLTIATIAADPTDELYREPLVAWLRTGTIDYCLVDIHVVCGDLVGPRDAEISALGRLVTNLRGQGAEKDYVVLGDYNRQSSGAGFASLNNSGWQFTDDGKVKATLGAAAYSNANVADDDLRSRREASRHRPSAS